MSTAMSKAKPITTSEICLGLALTIFIGFLTLGTIAHFLIMFVLRRRQHVQRQKTAAEFATLLQKHTVWDDAGVVAARGSSRAPIPVYYETFPAYI